MTTQDERRIEENKRYAESRVRIYLHERGLTLLKLDWRHELESLAHRMRVSVKEQSGTFFEDFSEAWMEDRGRNTQIAARARRLVDTVAAGNRRS